MKITLPKQMAKATLDQFLAKIVLVDGSVYHSSIELDFGSLVFIEPEGVVTLANVIEYVRSRGCELWISPIDQVTEAIGYLDDSGFFALYCGAPLRASAKPRPTTAPFRRIVHADSFLWLESRFGAWLARRLDQEPSGVASVQACMKEIFNNINDHSTLGIACTHMQHFPKKHEVLISVSDFGVGIPETIRRKFGGLSDGTAILEATKAGVTAGTSKRNRGVGLALLIEVITKLNGGLVKIRSGSGSVCCTKFVSVPKDGLSFYPGTLISITLNTTTFVADPSEEEDLQW